MSWTRERIEEAASDLRKAEKGKSQIGLLSERHPGLDMEAAYAIQAEYCKLRMAEGLKPAGWKIGLTSKAMQDALKIDTPDSGMLFEDMIHRNGSRIESGLYIQPRIEAEIAFIMAADLSPSPGRREVLAATESVAPALEILDTRIVRADPATGKTRAVFDTIADNAANAGLVLGDERADPETINMRWTGAIVFRNGVVEETGLGAGVLNDPVQGIIWLAKRLARQNDRIKKGDVVLSGSFIRPIEAPEGSEIEADFGGFGQVACRF